MDRQKNKLATSVERGNAKDYAATHDTEQFELSDDIYERLCKSYKTWRISRVVAVILIAMIYLAIKGAWTYSHNRELILGSVLCFAIFLLYKVFSKTFQLLLSSQDEIDAFMLDKNETYRNFLDIFPSKGIRRFKKYKRQKVRRQKTTKH